MKFKPGSLVVLAKTIKCPLYQVSSAETQEFIRMSAFLSRGAQGKIVDTTSAEWGEDALPFKLSPTKYLVEFVLSSPSHGRPDDALCVTLVVEEENLKKW